MVCDNYEFIVNQQMLYFDQILICFNLMAHKLYLIWTLQFRLSQYGGTTGSTT